jgi:hypothetical protein
MRHNALIVVLAVLWSVSCCFPATAWSQGRLSAGIMLWSQDTNLKVQSATDYDGSNITAEQRVKDWDVQGSAAGLRLTYSFPKMVSVYGEGGIAQATVRDKDVTDPEQRVNSRGLDDGTYLAFGARLAGDFSGSSNLFWQTSGTFSTESASLNQDVTTRWKYSETRFELGGEVGKWVQGVGIYGGLRFVHSDANLDQTDLTNLPGQQTRTTELGRDGSIDILLGAQTRGSDVRGFAEIGLVGTLSANAGLTYTF